MERRIVDCDVLVVGMGMAGLIAANRAAELDVDVIIIDKQPSGWWIGGDAIISGQGVHVCGRSPMLPPDELVNVINERTGGKAIPELVRVFADTCHRAMRWLMENGIEFEEPPGQERVIKPKKPVQGPWGLIKPGGLYDSSKYGGYLAMKLLESLLKERGVTILYATKAVKLITNDKNEVEGIVAKGKDQLFNIQAKATILCTGGFQRNSEMKVKYLGPHADQVTVFSGPGSTGDGHLMALEVGATVRSMNYVIWRAWPQAASTNEDLKYLDLDTLGRQGIIVNKNGVRICDESLGSSVYGSVMAKLSLDVDGLIVIDSVLYEKTKSLVDSIQNFGGIIHVANGIEELAEMAGVSLYLVSTIREFNQAVVDGKTSQLQIPKTANVNKITIPPFYGVPFTLGQNSTLGGVLVTPRGEVVDRDLKPIPRLYAAGNLMQGSLSGGVENRYASYVGNLAACLVFGIICGENASTWVKT